MSAPVDLVELSIRQFVVAWRIFCEASPGRRIESAPGLEYAFCGVPIPFFNVGILTGREISGAELQGRARTACAWASEKNVPWLLVVTHEALANGLDATAELDACGLAPLMPLYGMLAGEVAPVVAMPEGLTLEVPASDAACADILDVNSAAYGMPLDAGKPVWGTRAFWKDHYPVLGRVDGQPACSSVVMMAEGHRYVALVATTPGQQRRGYADAAMRKSLELSANAHPGTPTFLHATQAGRPVYERMGYQVVATHTVFIEKRFLGGA